LPRALLRECLRELEEPAHEFLRMFDAPFTFEIDQDVSFLVTKTNGVRHSAARLSGAELLILALSVRLALLQTFTRDAGFLCLDEPTYGLDVDNRRALESVIEIMRDYARTSGTQIIVVTHEPTLAARYDHRIDLTRSAPMT
jgi:DNA repair exonuclease SbcCD ATPase subunit